MGARQSKRGIVVSMPRAVTYPQVHVTLPIVSKQPAGAHKRDHISPKVRDAVWDAYHGDSNKGICYCCGVLIQRYNAGWHCSHVKAVSKKGDTSIDNLRPCCRHCNLSMGDQNLYVYIQQQGLQGPGARNVNSYLQQHASQVGDKRTNNWGKG